MEDSVPAYESTSEEDSGSESNNESSFVVEAALLLKTRVVLVYNQYLVARKVHHTNAAEQTIHTWRPGTAWDSVLVQLNYRAHEHAPTTHLW